MKMRLAFSIAIYSDPQILIVDEALSVGDAHFSAKCTQALKKRKEQNMSIIYVSHDLNSLKVLCDRVLLFNHGTLVEQGDPEQVVTTYNYLIAKLNDKDNKIEKKQNTSFGTFQTAITQVIIQGKASKSEIISAGEEARISVTCQATKDVKDMTVGILIKDKFGQHIFGTNTYHHEMTLDFQKDKTYTIDFDMPLNIGAGKYFITAAIHTQDTHTDDCSHWLENAATFEVAGFLGKPFIGLARLTPTIAFEETSER
jgi:lipopolysaccharide transport system ATP-binding protein